MHSFESLFKPITRGGSRGSEEPLILSLHFNLMAYFVICMPDFEPPFRKVWLRACLFTD